MAGYPAIEGSGAVEFWYRQKVVERIWNHQHKFRSKPHELLELSEYDQNDFELLRFARQFFGSWNNALTAAGLNAEPVINGKGRSNPKTLSIPKQRVLEIISALAASGEDMSPANMIVMHNPVWQSACGRNGYFSHWPSVLRKAGVDTHVLNNEPYWTDTRVRNNILELYESQLVLTTPFIRDNFWYLYRYGLRFFGSWKSAVDATRLGYENVSAEYAASGARQEQFRNNLCKMLKRSGRDLRSAVSGNGTAGNTPGPLGPFCLDPSNNTMVGTLPRSWLPGIEPRINRLLKNDPSLRLELYYLSGEPRQWRNDRVQFISVSDLIPWSFETRSDLYLKEILSLQHNVPSFL